MMRLTKIFASLSVSLFLSLSGLIASGIAHANGAASLSLTPASGSEASGANFTVNVYENSGSDTVNAVQANVSYPTASLTYDGYSSSSAFNFDGQDPSLPDTSGNLEFARATQTPTTGSQLVVSIDFTAKAGSGTATLGFASGSAVVNSTNSQNEAPLTTNGASFTLTGSSSGSSGGGSSGGSGGSSGSSGSSSSSSSSSTKSSGSTSSTKSSGSSSSSSTSSQSSTAGSVSNVAVGSITSDSVVVSWTSSVATTSEVDYGLSTQYGFNVVNSTSLTQHKVSLTGLVAGTGYHFLVKGVNASGSIVQGTDGSFRTIGADLVVKVVDQSNKPVKSAEVDIDGVYGSTNSSGEASLDNLPSGSVKVVVTFDGTNTDSTVSLTSAQNQTATVKIHVPSSKTGWIVPIIVIGVVVALALVARTFLIKEHEESSELSRHFPKIPGLGKVTTTTTTTPPAPTVSGPVVTPGSVSPPTATPPPSGSGQSPKPGTTINPNNKITK